MPTRPHPLTRRSAQRAAPAPDRRLYRPPTALPTVRSKRIYRNYLSRLLWLFDVVIRRS